jgi:hypothetical protein
MAPSGSWADGRVLHVNYLLLSIVLMMAISVADKVRRDRGWLAQVFAAARRRPRYVAAILVGDLLVAGVAISPGAARVENVASALLGMIAFGFIAVLMVFRHASDADRQR